MLLTAPHADVRLIPRDLQKWGIAPAGVKILIPTTQPRICKGFTRIVGSIVSTQQSAVNGFTIRQGTLSRQTDVLPPFPYSIDWLVINQWTLFPNTPQPFDLPVLCDLVSMEFVNAGVGALVTVYSMLRVI